MRNPSRNNYCGSDWNEALANCDLPDHWYLIEVDEDCPEDKVCYAGTDCKYIADLFPTLTLTLTDDLTLMPMTGLPTTPPMLSLVIYNTAENTRFCGEGWEDVRNTCRMGSHCSSGDDDVCPETQACYGWVSGCNIIDFREHWMETGNEIFGADHWSLPEGGWRVRWMWTLLPMVWNNQNQNR